MPRAVKSPRDPRGGHIRLYWDIFDSVAFMALGNSERGAYLALLRQRKSFNNGDISLPIKVARRYAGISSETTLAKCLRTLCAVGLIAVTREGGSDKGGKRIPTLYRFTDSEVYAVPAKFIEATKATDEWKAITSIALAIEAIGLAEAMATAKADAKKTKNLLQNLEETTPKNEVVKAKTTPKNGVWQFEPLQNLEPEKTP